MTALTLININTQPFASEVMATAPAGPSKRKAQTQATMPKDAATGGDTKRVCNVQELVVDLTHAAAGGDAERVRIVPESVIDLSDDDNDNDDNEFEESRCVADTMPDDDYDSLFAAVKQEPMQTAKDFARRHALVAVWSLVDDAMNNVSMTALHSYPAKTQAVLVERNYSLFSLMLGSSAQQRVVEYKAAILGPTWGDVYKAVNDCVRRSNNHNYRFIEYLELQGTRLVVKLGS